MAIARLVICEWQGPHRRDVDVDDPSWSDIESAIRALNNRNLNDIHLYPERSNHRVIDLESALRAARAFYEAEGFA